MWRHCCGIEFRLERHWQTHASNIRCACCLQVKRLVTADSEPADSSWVQGVVCRKSLAHKRMRSSIVQPRIMLLAGAVEPQATQGALSASASKLSSFGALLDQEQQYLSAAVDRIASFQPDILLVERSVARCVACCPSYLRAPAPCAPSCACSSTPC